MKLPVRRKCSICKGSMDAEFIPSDPPTNPWRIFNKSIAVYICAQCDAGPDPDSRDIHKQITDESGTMET
jgi:hypothetical protein